MNEWLTEYVNHRQVLRINTTFKCLFVHYHFVGGIVYCFCLSLVAYTQDGGISILQNLHWVDYIRFPQGDITIKEHDRFCFPIYSILMWHWHSSNEKWVLYSHQWIWANLSDSLLRDSSTESVWVTSQRLGYKRWNSCHPGSLFLF